MNANLEQATVKKLFSHLIPVIALLYFVAFIDRANIGIAALTMNADLGISAAVYGMGAGIFFIGYFLFEIPSNIILAKIGARKWITRILVTWGAISCCFAFAQNSTQMLILRFLLGLAEAGFYPGVIYYISTWFPANRRAQAVASFHAALPIALAVGNILGGLILGMNGIAGLKGWQWLFLVEGIPSMLLGVVSWKYLADSPKEAKWLTGEEQNWLINELASEEKAKKIHVPVKEVFAKPSVWVYSVYYLIVNIGFYGITFWMPQIVKKLSGANPTLSSIYAGLPWIIAAIVMIYVGKMATKSSKKKSYVIVLALIAAFSLFASAYSTNLALALALLAVCISAAESGVGPFWAFPQREYSGVVGAAAMANINAIGNLGGFFGPTILGFVVQTSGGDFKIGLIAMAACLAIAGAVATAFKEKN